MTVEYIFLLLISGLIIGGAFGFGNGPVGMFHKGVPPLAYKIERNLETGRGFVLKPTEITTPKAFELPEKGQERPKTRWEP